MFTLLSNEKIILKKHPHIVVLLFSLGLIILVWLILILLPKLFLGVIEKRAVILLFSFAFSFIALVIFLDWWYTRFYLTNLRVIKVRGIIGKTYSTIYLLNIQDISFNFGLIGWLFNFGTLVIESAGTYGKITFNYLPSPKKVQLKIEKQIKYLKVPENIPFPRSHYKINL